MVDSNQKVSIMNINFLNVTKTDFLNHYLFPRLNKGEKTFVVTANPEIVMKTREDPAYKEIVQSANYVIPDGAGILLAAKYMKQPLQERIAGIELVLDLLTFAEKQGMSCYFLGAKDYINEKAVLEMKKRFPDLTIAGNHHGFFDLDDPQIVEDVAQSNADIVLVALGLPRQEVWINQHKGEFSKGLFMGVGGSFDILAGEVKRAPKAWIKLNLEWLYRIVKEPFRVKRIFKVFEFMIRVILKK